MTSADVEVERFDAHTAPESDLIGCHEVMRAWWQRDKPDLPTLSYADAVGRLRQPFPGFGEVIHWVTRSRGEIVGLVTVYFLEGDSSHIALTEIVVRPRDRRRGIGTAVLRALVPELRARRRELVEGWQLTVGGDGPEWAASLGFRAVHTVLMQTLEIADTDPSLWEVEVPAGYRTHRWIGATPDGLVTSYAEARQAIHDAPLGDLGYQEPQWTVEHVREREGNLRAAGVEQRVVVAMHEATGVVAGLTELEVHPNDLTWGFQRDTAVLSAHRGHGLGRAIKAEMIRWLLADRPDFTRVQTTTGAENTHMSRVNHQLGFATARTMVAVNQELADLETRLSR